MTNELVLPKRYPILVSGVLPPPMGGMTAYYQTLLNSTFPQRVDMHFVQTSSQNRRFSSTGRLSISNLVYSFSDCWRFTRAIIKYHPKMVHIGTAAGLSFIKNSICVIIARIFGLTVILHPHCSLAFLYHERSKIWQWYFRQVLSLTKGIIAISKEWMQLEVIRAGSKVYFLPNAINVSEFRDLAEVKLSAIRETGLNRILYIGNLGKEKGSFDLLKVAKNVHSKMENVCFDLVGGELNQGELSLIKEEVKKQQLEEVVRIHAPAFGKDKLSYFREAGIFIFPSYYEGMPLAVLEAMASGLPIISSRVGGIPDLIEDGINGILIEPGNIDQISSELINLVKNYNLRYAMAKANYKLAVEKYDIEAHVTRLVELYNIILNDS